MWEATMRLARKHIFAYGTCFMLLWLALIPIPVTSHDTGKFLSSDEEELFLLRGEHYLYLTATENVNQFHLRFTFPPIYGYQRPLLLEIFNDTTGPILQYTIENDTSEPNKLINFTIDSLVKDETILVHFTWWVLVQNHEFDDLPTTVTIPEKEDLPEDTTIWLTATEVVQKENKLIRFKARQLRGLSTNLIRYAGRIAPFLKYHRFPSFLMQLFVLNSFFAQDALTTLFINGENIGRSHLACAFFRGDNIPARVLLAHNDQGFWTQMHYMLEYYCPGYGWVLLDPTKGQTPYATKRQIINRICYPEDENDTKTDYIHPYMTGEERWLWIDTESVQPYFVDCDEGSKSQMFTMGEIFTDALTANTALFLSQTVFQHYQQYLGENLTGQNRHHFHNATIAQRQALSAFQNYDIQGFLQTMNHAQNEYENITL